MNTALTPEVEQFVQGQVAAGRFRSPSEMIQAALTSFMQTSLETSGSERQPDLSANFEAELTGDRMERGEGIPAKAVSRDFARAKVSKFPDILQSHREWD